MRYILFKQNIKMRNLLIFLNVLLLNIIIVNTSFQTTIFSETNKDYPGKNICLSPLSIFQVLGLTANGAVGNTLDEMVSTLEASSLENVNGINLKLIQIIKQFETVELANGVMTIFDPIKSFSKMCDKYEAPIEKLISVNQVNEWCSEKTHGKITNILDELDPNTVMLLLNAVYFRADWEYPFNPDKTYTGSFVNPTEKDGKKVQMMTQTEMFNYYEDKNVQAIELPYKNDSMTAVVILPNKEVDMNKYVNSLSLNDDFVNGMLDKMSGKMVRINLPRFEIEFFSKLKPILIRMGMVDAFNNADFSGINGYGGLYIDDVIHKTFLNVDEFGSEAAAVTIVDMRKSAPIPEVEMDVTRPFIFILRSKKLPKNNDFLFMAKVESL